MDKKKLILTSPFIFVATKCRINIFDDDSEEELDRKIESIFQKYVTVPRVSIMNFFEEVVPSYSEEEFIRYFRISRDVFEDLANKYRHCALYENITHQHLVTSADKSLAIFLWFCAHEAVNYRDISNLFNIAISTVFSIIRRTISFVSSLAPLVIKWPTEREMREESEYHLRRYGIPGVIGAVGGTHIRIDPPAKNMDDYVDQKGDITLVVQAVCNHKKNFLHISIGYPGSMHDACIFRCSKLSSLLSSTPNGYRILGDSAYSCQVKLMPPYRDNGCLTQAQKNFNYQLSSSRVMIEHSFNILKQRFRQLYYCKLKGNNTLCHFIRACFVLHNLSRESDLEVLNIDPCTNYSMLESYPPLHCNENSIDNEGKLLRDTICASLITPAGGCVENN